jgi:2-C-methyl-D-erythritol 4-phosphate cytidylyltransferase
MREFAIIVAGGSGTRMGSAVSKQYLEVGNKPILMHTLSRFYKYSVDLDLILVIPPGDFILWKKLCEQYGLSIPHKLVAGGASRFQSVKNGLATIMAAEGLVAIHDGVRPFVSQEVITKGYKEARETGSAIAVIPLKDSIRKINDEGRSISRNRDFFRLVQTPQTFLLSKIKTAFDVEEKAIFTDDATVYEDQGWLVHLIEGNPGNIKITTPEDMEYAEFIIQKHKDFT